MNNFLELFGARSNQSSPFCRDFEDENELCEVFENVMPKDNEINAEDDEQVENNVAAADGDADNKQLNVENFEEIVNKVVGFVE